MYCFALDMVALVCYSRAHTCTRALIVWCGM
nr:MAG TPA: hypothetical protein [Caudoviricetes sp.]